MKNMTKWAKDVAERMLWTGVEGAAGLGITEVAGLDTWWAVPIGAGLAWVKGFAAKHVGNKESASTVPSV